MSLLALSAVSVTAATSYSTNDGILTITVPAGETNSVDAAQLADANANSVTNIVKTGSGAILMDDATAIPCALGDWRKTLGRSFSGKAEYSVAFDSPRAGKAQLDLGKVCWSASVRMNGKDAGARYFGPFVFEVDLAEGRNELTVTVANLLANQVGDPEIRARISGDYPPLPNYERYQGVYDNVNHDSGLFGSVTVRLYETED